MYEIVKVLLSEGIDEETIHEVLDVIEENYEIIDEGGNLAQTTEVQGKKKGYSSSKIKRLVDKAKRIPALNDYHRNDLYTLNPFNGQPEKVSYEIVATGDPNKGKTAGEIGAEKTAKARLEKIENLNNINPRVKTAATNKGRELYNNTVAKTSTNKSYYNGTKDGYSIGNKKLHTKQELDNMK